MTSEGGGRAPFKGRRTSRAQLYRDRLRQLLRLPACYRRMRASPQGPSSRIKVALDLIILFFSHKTFPNHYASCGLGNMPRSRWASYYHFTLYSPHHKARLQRNMQPYVYRILFDDKYLCAMHCRALGIPIPRTFGTIEPGQDYRRQLAAWLAEVPAGLFVKPALGSGGQGAAVVQARGADIVVRAAGKTLGLSDYAIAERSIVQAKLIQDARMAAISSASVNTARIITILPRGGEPFVAQAVMRCGVGDSIVDNMVSGGLVLGLDLETGALHPCAYDHLMRRYSAHPTTNVAFEGLSVPEWKQVRETALEVQSRFPFYRMLGLDIAVDHNGAPVVIEINGSPDLVGMEQQTGPLLENEGVLRTFGEEGVLVNKHQRRLYALLRTRDTVKS